MATEAQGPLAGVKVVELGVWVAGPAAGGILADWGADVVKIEPPTGDPARTFRRMLGGDLPTNPVFELDNRSKRSISVDLSTDEGRQVALELIDGADVFLSNIRVSALERAGLGPGALRARNPRLVYAVVTGYGLAGPDADRPAYDIAAFWARSGLAAALTPPGAELPFQRGGMGDHSVGVTAAGMVSAALYARERTGQGDLVSTSLLRQGAYTIGFDLNISLMWGLPVRVGTRTTMGNPSINNYTAGDGRRFWIVGLEGERHWPPLARAVGRPEWLGDERYATAAGRWGHAAGLIEELDRIFATKPLAEWAEVFATEPDFFWAPVQTIEELAADPQFAAGGGLVEVPDEAGSMTMVATPADFAERPARPRFRAPRLGEHTTEVLASLGYAEDRVAELVAAGAVFTEDTARGPE
ncbi:MAG TPA: CoA transferase [Acidimicrobiales bacterium]|nr:CoA transferase [Acidimicrobiales bacterium]